MRVGVRCGDNLTNINVEKIGKKEERKVKGSIKKQEARRRSIEANHVCVYGRERERVFGLLVGGLIGVQRGCWVVI